MKYMFLYRLILVISVIGLFMNSPVHAQESPSWGDGLLMTSINVSHAITEQWGMQGSLFTVAVPSVNYRSEYVYFGGYYSFGQELTVGAMTGMSFNFPDKKSVPLLSVNAWGELLPGLKYYAEVDAMWSPAWFYTASLSYSITDRLSAGLWFQGFGEGEQTLRGGPMASYKFVSDFGALELVGAVLYNNHNTFQPVIKLVAWL